MDADGAGDRVTLRLDAKRPARCRHLVVVQLEGGTTVAATVPPLGWPGGNPQLLLLAEIDGRPGLEPVITLSPANVYRPGMVFTLSRGELLRMRLEQATAPDAFPALRRVPGWGGLRGTPRDDRRHAEPIAEGGDRFWDTTRSFYRSRQKLGSPSFEPSGSWSMSATRLLRAGPKCAAIRSSTARRRAG